MDLFRIILVHRNQYIPSLRLYSEIDHIHLSSEAQCVSHHLPQVDCHIYHSADLTNQGEI